MTSLHAQELPSWHLDGQPHPLLVAACDLYRRQSRAAYGHEDFCSEAAVVADRLSHMPDQDRHYCVVMDGERCIGAAVALLPLRENRTSADIDLIVDPEGEPGPIIEALLALLTPILEAAGRTTWVVWTGTSADAPGERVRPATGAGEVPLTPTNLWLREHGWTLEQAEVNSALEVAAPLPAELCADVADKAAAYTIETWVGATPEHHLDAMAQMKARFSIDLPQGNREVEAEQWDAERVRERDAAQAKTGETRFTAAAFAGDQMVAYTQLSCPPDNPLVAFQHGTLVHGDHRGHRLGFAVKIANIEQLRRERPAVERIHTWNADENAHMRAINTALGFAPRAVDACWQKKL